MLISPSAALAQRMVFPSPDPSPDPMPPTVVAQVPAGGYSGSTYQGPTTYTVPGTPSPYTQPSVTTPAPYTPTATMTPFGYTSADPNQPYTPAAPTTGIWTAPAGGGQAPVATFNGTVQPLPAQPSPAWDPYGSPGSTPAPLLPSPLAPAPGQYDPNAGVCPPQQPLIAVPSQFPLPAVLAPAQRFLQGVSIDYDYLPGQNNSSKGLGSNDIDLRSSFALPILGLPQEPPLIVSPGFTFHFWDGPAFQGTNGADMPGQTYDAYLQADWNPQLGPGFGAELDARIGVDSDFTKIEGDSIRLTGKGLAVIDIPETNFKFKAGVWYMNLVSIKLLPAGGLVWTPSPYTEIDFLFPNPRITQYLTTYGQTEWWWYLRGAYGGDSWTIKRSGSDAPGVAGSIDLVSYEDLRVALGLDFKRGPIVNGHIEGGYAFDRELIYLKGPPSSFGPNGVFYVGAGITF